MDLAEVIDRVEIRSLVDRYAIACDSGDWVGFRELFTKDSVFDYSEFGGPQGDLETTVAWLSSGLSRYAGLHHNMTTHHALIDGDTAKAVTYFIAYHTTPDGKGGEEMMELGGFYKDRLVRQADGWRICERHDVSSWLATPIPPRLSPPPAWYGTMNHHKVAFLHG